MFARYWDADTIKRHILDLWARGEPLYSSHVHAHHAALHQASFRVYGNWELAITDAGLNYAEIRRYRQWNSARILAAIREAYAEGQDLSWRQCSTGKLASLAAAAVKRQYFGSWDKALQAAGVPVEEVRRYRSWSNASIIAQIQRLQRQRQPLCAREIQERHPHLYFAACHHFGSWHLAVEAAGLAYAEIAIRVTKSPRQPAAASRRKHGPRLRHGRRRQSRRA